MALGSFLKKEFITAVRRGTVFVDRRGSVLAMSAVVAVVVVSWDWQGWDRASIRGSASFALHTFCWIAGVQMVLALGVIPGLIAPRIAGERDRKSLDSLLATRLSAWEIVLGKLGAGLLRYLHGLLTLAPLFMLMVFLGGIDPRLILLALAALTSTAFALASLSIAVSAGARTRATATLHATGLGLAWLFLPALIILIGPKISRPVASWLYPVAIRLLDSSPIAIALTLSPILYRGPLIEVVTRMIALQMAASAAFLAWAIYRLRPASRAAYDVASSSAARKLLRARWRPRPPCGDDPVLWHELHTGRMISAPSLWADRLCNAAWVGILAYALSWFAVPAFGELPKYGYGPAPGPATNPDVNPMVRFLAGTFTSSSISLQPGHGRLEFNIVLRQLTGVIDFLFVLMIAGAAAESVAVERERDTWLGLITTPLTGGEILRAKMIGAIWKVRGLLYFTLGMWAVGLAAGALHPLGLLLTVTSMGLWCWLLAAFGVSMSLRGRDRSQATSRTIGPIMLLLGLGALPFFLPGMASVLLGSATLPFQAWVSLLSYDDVQGLIRTGAIPAFATIGMPGTAATAIILVAWLVSTIAQAIAAFLMTRSAIRDFDALIGRPVRARTEAEQPGFTPPHADPHPAQAMMPGASGPSSAPA